MEPLTRGRRALGGSAAVIALLYFIRPRLQRRLFWSLDGGLLRHLTRHRLEILIRCSARTAGSDALAIPHPHRCSDSGRCTGASGTPVPRWRAVCFLLGCTRNRHRRFLQAMLDRRGRCRGNGPYRIERGLVLHIATVPRWFPIRCADDLSASRYDRPDLDHDGLGWRSLRHGS